MRYLVSVIFILTLITGQSGSSTLVKEVEVKKTYQRDVEYILGLIEKNALYDSIYEQTIKFIKKNEGFRSYPYLCLAEVKTVGYGHVIRGDESLSYPLTKAEADSLLREDFEQKIKFIEKDFDIQRIENPYKVLALAHFIFNIGEGNLVESKLYETLKKTGKLDSSIKKFIHIRTKNGYIKSTHLLKMRKYEYNLFNETT